MAKIPDVPLGTWKPLYEAAERFARMTPWKRVGESQFFGVREPGTGELGYGCVLGSQGDFLALAVYRGAEAFRVYQRMLREEPSADDNSAFLQDCLMAQFADSEYVEQADRAVMRALGLRFSGPKAWPLFRSYRPDCFPWHLNEQEAVSLTFALHCGCDWVEKLDCRVLESGEHSGQIFTYLPKDDPSSFETAWTPRPADAPSRPAELDPAPLSKLRASAPKRVGEWEAEVVPLPGVMMDRDVPYILRVALLVDRASSFVLPIKAEPPGKPAAQLVADALVHAAGETGRLPKELVVRDKSLLPTLEEMGRMLDIRIGTGRFRSLPRAKMALLDQFANRGRGGSR